MINFARLICQVTVVLWSKNSEWAVFYAPTNTV